MIKITVNKGKTSIEASGDNATLYAEACVLVKSIYTSFEEELPDKKLQKCSKRSA